MPAMLFVGGPKSIAGMARSYKGVPNEKPAFRRVFRSCGLARLRRP
jgi:hypothetical protein